jgi:LmbE family N-acetylglucosaminyl deacetylase
MDPDTGLDREGHPIIPDFVVDVASQMDIKKRALGAHESQRNWLAKHHGMDNYIEEMCRWTENCGRRAGLQYGEGFRRYKGHPYPQTALLEQLLGDRVRVLSPV